MFRFLCKTVSNKPLTEREPPPEQEYSDQLRESATARPRGCLGGGLMIRAVDAGSCNGCELEFHALSNVYYDLERFGLSFTASPRHADVLLVTGPVTKNMREALKRTWEATPEPKWLVAIGDCSKDGGVFKDGSGIKGVEPVAPWDLVISGCPPSPTRLLQGLLALLEVARDPRQPLKTS